MLRKVRVFGMLSSMALRRSRKLKDFIDFRNAKQSSSSKSMRRLGSQQPLASKQFCSVSVYDHAKRQSSIRFCLDLSSGPNQDIVAPRPIHNRFRTQRRVTRLHTIALSFVPAISLKFVCVR